MNRRVLGGALLLGLVAGCGGSRHATTSAPSGAPSASVLQSTTDSPTPPPAASPTMAALDPCSLITKQEADQLTGVSVQDPQPAGRPPMRCVWPTPLTGPVGQVEVDVGDGAKKFMDIETTIGHQLDSVAGLADEAVIEDSTIFFRSGPTWVAIHVVGGPAGSASRGPLEALAAKVLQRL